MENYTFWFENFYKKVIGKAPKKGLKNLYFANWNKKYPHFFQINQYIVCTTVQHNISIHLEKNVCDNTFFPQKSEILTNIGPFLAFKVVIILLGGICMPNLKLYT